MLASDGELPIREQFVLVGFNPRLNHLQLLRRSAASQHAAIFDRNGRLVPGVADMNSLGSAPLVAL
jgi:hypothetical protein